MYVDDIMAVLKAHFGENDGISICGSGVSMYALTLFKGLHVMFSPVKLKGIVIPFFSLNTLSFPHIY